MTRPQHLVAQDLAIEIRSKRAAWRRQVTAAGSDEGRALLAAAILSTPPHLATLRLHKTLTFVRHFGNDRANRTLVAADIEFCRWNTLLRDLTDRERTALAQALNPAAAEVAA